jgi:hypothetical protein
MNSMGGFGFGKSSSKVPGYHQRQVSTLDPQQQELFSLLFGGLKGGLGGGLEHLSKLASGDQSYFGQLEAPALRQFGALQGNLASRFSGMGTGARRSSGFGNATSSAGQQLSESLQSQRMGLQQNAISQLLGLSGSLLGRQNFENVMVPKQQSGLQQLLASLGGGVGQGAGQGIGMAGMSKLLPLLGLI